MTSEVLERLRQPLSDRYRVERELGAGGMATVYLAHDLKHERDVAIKVLHQDLAAALGAERFLAEIKTTAKLQHPHILPLLDSGEAAGLLYYVMPYVAGESLRDRLTREKQLPIDDAVRIAREVADALGHAHGHGIIHRDIKPENILLQEGHALVADFGIALAVQSAGGQRMTQTGLSLGTPQYMSPEQAMGEKAIDLRADIYALGAVTYEMLTGEPPFTGATVQAIVSKVMASEPEPLTRVRRTVPGHVEGAVLKALAKLPADRWASGHQFGLALAAVGGTGSPPAMRALPKRAKPLLASAGLVALGLVVGWFAYHASFGGWTGQKTDPVRRLSILLPDSMPMAFVGEAPLGIGRRSIAVSPDGQTVVYVGWYRGRTHLFVRPMASEQPRRLEGTAGAYGPFFSPDGRWLGFFAEHMLKKVEVSGGMPVELTTAPETYGAVWLDDGRILFAKDEGAHPTLVDENGGAAAAASLPPLLNPAVLPGTPWIISQGNFSPAFSQLGDSVPLHLTSTELERLWLPPRILPSTGPQYVAGGAVVVEAAGRLHAFSVVNGHAKVRGSMVAIDEYVREEAMGAAAQFVVGGDGTLVYAPGESVTRSVLVVAGRNGRTDTLSLPPARYVNPAFSPDGRRIAVTAWTSDGVDLVVYDLASRSRLTAVSSPAPLFDPYWDADGKRILLSNPAWIPKAAKSYEVIATGGRLRERQELRGSIVGRSTDAALTAVAHDTVVEVVRKDGKSAGMLPQPAGAWVSFSSDGKWVMWTAVGQRYYEAFISALPLGGPVYSVTPSGCMEAKWMPSGREIVCFKSDGFLYSVPLSFTDGDVRGGTPRRLTRSRLLETNGVTWALSPDGQKMVYVAHPTGDSTRVLNVVTNFGAEVRRRMESASSSGRK